jgi:lactate dehydrogenase-like 2-hydroxyacid dehydrogenase
MKSRLVITRRIFPEVYERLLPHFEVSGNQDDVLPARADLLARVADCDALFVVSSDRVDRELIAAAPRLRIVASGSVGFNHIDRVACAERGIAVTNTPDVLNEATADMAWTLLMAAARRVSESERWLRDGQWDRWAFDQFLGADVWRATLGIVGMGRIGSAIARRARGFEMRIVYHNRSESAAAVELGATRVELDQLLAEADHLMLVVPYSPQTHHLIGARELALMKPTATITNIARGGVVDDRALAEALAAGRIAAAGLDVFENEPAIDPALLACRNLVMTPHIGSATRSSRVAMAALAAANLIAHAEGRPLPTPVL